MKNNKWIYISVIGAIIGLNSCSTTSSLEPDETLFVGLKPIEYTDYEPCDHFLETQIETEAALATAPNGALFGSSYYRTPFPYGLWIYNAFHDSDGVIGKWLVNSFGNEPVILKNVNPELRASVAESVLQNHGYFRSSIDYDIISAGKQKAKIAYKVKAGELFSLDSIDYINFPLRMEQTNFREGSLLKRDDAFNIATLDAERNRIFTHLRNNGYYYYQQNYTSYLADTLKVPGKVQLMMRLSDSLPDEAMRKWVVGNMDVKIQRHTNEQLIDTIQRRTLTIFFGGKQPPLRPRVLLQDVRLRSGQFFSQDAYEESMNRMATKGIYKSASIEFTPRLNADGTYATLADSIGRRRISSEELAAAGVLDMTINAILDKPYDISLQANYLGKTSGRMGPGAALGFSKRNAFRGGELLSFGLAANYEFQLGGEQTAANSYEISGDLTLTLPRLLAPKFILGKRRRWQTTPQTIMSVSRETINRSGFFRRHILSGEMSYTFHPNRQIRHQFTPLMVEYDRLAELTDDYAEAIKKSPVLLSTMNDYFMTKMRYSFAYTSPANYLHPIYCSFTITESSNLLALGYLAAGKSWNERNKETFKTPFAQFVKFEGEFRKTWQLSEHSSAVAHINAGVIKAFGNSDSAPFSEYFYIGGANTLRAFSTRSLGPGSYHNGNTKYSYLTNVGDLKFVMNLEYRPRLFGSLYGVIFLDAGNIWRLKETKIAENTGDDDAQDYLNNIIGNINGGKFQAKNFAKDLAVNVGVGLRYDLDFFVLRLDWGWAIHSPYSTDYSGYFNCRKFNKSQCLNFAIGYPF